MGAIITRMIMAPVTTIVVGVIPTTLLLRDPLVLHPRHPEAVEEEAQENKWLLDFSLLRNMMCEEERKTQYICI